MQRLHSCKDFPPTQPIAMVYYKIMGTRRTTHNTPHLQPTNHYLRCCVLSSSQMYIEIVLKDPSSPRQFLKMFVTIIHLLFSNQQLKPFM